jgi:hypothetical protein
VILEARGQHGRRDEIEAAAVIHALCVAR